MILDRYAYYPYNSLYNVSRSLHTIPVQSIKAYGNAPPEAHLMQLPTYLASLLFVVLQSHPVSQSERLGSTQHKQSPLNEHQLQFY